MTPRHAPPFDKLRVPLALLGGLLLAGCSRGRAAPDVRPYAPPAALRAPLPLPPAPTVPLPYGTEHVAGHSVEGRPIPVVIRGLGPDVSLVIATIHGNEPAGTPLAERLLAHLDANPGLLRGRRVVVMPVTNPDGRMAGTRTNALGVDINRNFEAPNRRNGGRYGQDAFSEPEAAAIAAVVRQFRPSRVLSIHQPLCCVDWDGPAESLAREIAEITGLPVKKLGTRPGSMGAWAQARDLPLVTLELPPRVEALNADELWRRYGEALLLFALY